MPTMNGLLPTGLEPVF